MEERKKSYFEGIGYAIKSLATGLGVTMREYFTKKVTEQYPENRKTTLHVSQRHRSRLWMKRDENDVPKCTSCMLCEMACPNGSIKIQSETITTEDGKRKKHLINYAYDLGDCMFCNLCVNACNFDAIHFANDFESSVFERNKLVINLDKEHYKSSLENIRYDGGAPQEIGTFNTSKK